MGSIFFVVFFGMIISHGFSATGFDCASLNGYVKGSYCYFFSGTNGQTCDQVCSGYGLVANNDGVDLLGGTAGSADCFDILSNAPTGTTLSNQGLVNCASNPSVHSPTADLVCYMTTTLAGKGLCCQDGTFQAHSTVSIPIARQVCACEPGPTTQAPTTTSAPTTTPPPQSVFYALIGASFQDIGIVEGFLVPLGDNTNQMFIVNHNDVDASGDISDGDQFSLSLDEQQFISCTRTGCMLVNSEQFFTLEILSATQENTYGALKIGNKRYISYSSRFGLAPKKYATIFKF